MLILHIIILLATFYFLAIICDQYFVGSLEKISKKLKLSSEITGATFMAVGSSAPELFTSIFALFAIFGSSMWNESLGAGTIVWSALFNILVIIWVSAIFMNSKKNKDPNKNRISRQPLVRDLCFYLITIGILLISFHDGKVVLMETLILVACYIIYLFVVRNRGKRLKYETIEETIEEIEEESSKNRINKFVIKILNYIIPDQNKWKQRFWRTFIISIIIIAALSHFMVESAIQLADILNIPKAIVWLTILAAGTSIPDLISSVIVAKKWKWDMAISNALWSNVFDILIGLGLVYFVYILVTPWVDYIPVDTHNLTSSVILLFASAFVLLVFLITQKRRIKKYAWFLFIAIYVGYIIYKIALIN